MHKILVASQNVEAYHIKNLTVVESYCNFAKRYGPRNLEAAEIDRC